MILRGWGCCGIGLGLLEVEKCGFYFKYVNEGGDECDVFDWPCVFVCLVFVLIGEIFMIFVDKSL